MINRQVLGTEVEYGLYLKNPSQYSLPDFTIAFNPTKTRELGLLTYGQSWEGVSSNSYSSGSRIWLFNGGHYYLDCNTTPEYCTPETASARDLTCYEKAGDLIVKTLADLEGSNSQRFLVVKHNRGKKCFYLQESAVGFGGARAMMAANSRAGAGGDENTSGHHENYLVEMPKKNFASFFSQAGGYGAERLVSFLVARLIFSGAGFFSSLPSSEFRSDFFQISPRAAFTNRIVDTTSTGDKKPIICPREELDTVFPNYNRLHLILGDLNMSEVSIYLTAGLTALVVRLLQDQPADLAKAPLLQHPIAALQSFSSDPFLQKKAKLKNHFNGRSEATALEIMAYFLDQAEEFLSQHSGTEDERQVLILGREMHAKLKKDPLLTRGELDWTTKFCLFESLLKAERFSLFDLCGEKGRIKNPPPELIKSCQALDLTYHYLTADGLYHRLIKRGWMRRILTDEEIQMATLKPPADRRAAVRSEILHWLWERKGKFKAVINWDAIAVFKRERPAPELKDRIFLDPLDFKNKNWQAFKEQEP